MDLISLGEVAMHKIIYYHTQLVPVIYLHDIQSIKC